MGARRAPRAGRPWRSAPAGAVAIWAIALAVPAAGMPPPRDVPLDEAVRQALTASPAIKNAELDMRVLPCCRMRR
ncbi:MAG: hypothetical protein FJZ01_03980 [Candidatus Sericytochromatia bacterium]|nr:hypothetical protein [Candidatus Tanganyikabacteria bacterium]